MNKSRYKIIKKDRPGNTMYQMYVLEDDYVIEKITSSISDGYIASFYISNINVESIESAWSTRFSKTYTTSIDRDLSDEFWASRFYADNNVIQSIDGISDTYLLDSRGDYHGTQYEKYVYDFDGVDGEIDTGIFPPSYNGEVEMFIKVTGAGTIFSNRHSSTNYFEVKAGAVSSALITVELKESPNTYTLSSTFVNDGDWHKVNIRYTGTELYITIDDTLDSSLTSLTQITSNLQELVIGSRGNLSNYVTMQLSNFKWLSLAGELLIFYKCEEQAGTTAYDSSGYGNHGTLVGGVTHTDVRVLMLVNYTNLVGYTKVGSVIVPRDESDITFDVLGNDLSRKGEVAYDIKFVNSNCILAGATTEGQFNFDCTGLTIKSYEGTATATLDTVNDKLTFTAGTIYNLVLSNDYHFPLAEGSGTTSYRFEDSTTTITWTNSSWTTQDEYHHNITQGFNILSGVKVPYKIGGVYTYPAVIGHNVAETELTMEVFREKLGENPIFYNQIDLSSNEIDYYDLGTNDAFTSFITSQNLKTDIQTLSSSDPAYAFKRRLYDLQPAVTITLSGLLNDYTGAAAAYSLVLLYDDYTGDAITVRRASDNATTNIGFSNNELDTASLETFCSGTDGFVSVWFDQSGNANNAVQTTASSQPKIVSSGSVILENGKPAINTDGVDDYLQSGIISFTNPVSMFIVNKRLSGPGKVTGLNNNFNTIGFVNSTTSTHLIGYLFFQQGPQFTPAFGDNNQNLLYGKTSTIGTDWEAGANGVLVTNSGENIGITTPNQITISAVGSAALFMNAFVQAFIVYDSDQSANRTGIETALNDYYNIF